MSIEPMANRLDKLVTHVKCLLGPKLTQKLRIDCNLLVNGSLGVQEYVTGTAMPTRSSLSTPIQVIAFRRKHTLHKDPCKLVKLSADPRPNHAYLQNQCNSPPYLVVMARFSDKGSRFYERPTATLV
jgi:hypothetical protein